MKQSIIILSFIFIFSLLPQPASAHFLKTDQTVGAVIHVTPNDEPVAGLPSSFFFEFKDEANKFRPDECDCTFLVKRAGKTIYSQKLFQNNDKPSLKDASISYTFPQTDIYQVQIEGKSKAENLFAPFTLSWDFRVAKQVDPTVSGAEDEKNNRLIRYGLIFGVVGIVVMFFVIRHIFGKPHGNRKEKAEQTEENKY